MGYHIVNKYQMFFKPLQNSKKGLFNESGQVVSYPINDGAFEIRYTIKTMRGLSGSPILTRDGQSEIVVGIHTHQGLEAGYNSGLYFT